MIGLVVSLLLLWIVTVVILALYLYLIAKVYRHYIIVFEKRGETYVQRTYLARRYKDGKTGTYFFSLFKPPFKFVGTPIKDFGRGIIGTDGRILQAVLCMDGTYHPMSIAVEGANIKVSLLHEAKEWMLKTIERANKRYSYMSLLAKWVPTISMVFIFIAGIVALWFVSNGSAELKGAWQDFANALRDAVATIKGTNLTFTPPP